MTTERAHARSAVIVGAGIAGLSTAWQQTNSLRCKSPPTWKEIT
jgi:glycine/D-amino acid oxidase-like deaminating enzyme